MRKWAEEHAIDQMYCHEHERDEQRLIEVLTDRGLRAKKESKSTLAE